MSKRIAILSVSLVMLLALFGCSSNSSSQSSVSSQSSASTSAGQSLFTADDWPTDSEVVTGIPVPHFSKNADSMSILDQAVTATWKGLSDDEVAKYVEELKASQSANKINENKASSSYSLTINEDRGVGHYRTISLNYAKAVSENNTPSQLMIHVSVF